MEKVLKDSHGDVIVMEIDLGELVTLTQGRQEGTRLEVIHPEALQFLGLQRVFDSLQKRDPAHKWDTTTLVTFKYLS